MRIMRKGNRPVNGVRRGTYSMRVGRVQAGESVPAEGVDPSTDGIQEDEPCDDPGALDTDLDHQDDPTVEATHEDHEEIDYGGHRLRPGDGQGRISHPDMQCIDCQGALVRMPTKTPGEGAYLYDTWQWVWIPPCR